MFRLGSKLHVVSRRAKGQLLMRGQERKLSGDIGKLNGAYA